MRESAIRDFWTFEDDLAYYRLIRGAQALEVFNQSFFLGEFGTWQLGVGGVVVSKLPLEIKVARDAVAESECPVWSGIRNVIEALAIRELTGASRLSDSQRKFLAIRIRSLMEWASEPKSWKAVELLTAPSGQHLPLSALADYTRFVHIPEPGVLACAAHDKDGTFVVTDALLDRFGTDSLDDWLALMSDAGLLPESYSVADARDVMVQQEASHGLA
ncbi:MAG TPA: hypothetical protein VFA39_17845 [Steroidobacteraceae bacterium]|nr:hypothetical protein [Steroidobacteraceae bacterium]